MKYFIFAFSIFCIMLTFVPHGNAQQQQQETYPVIFEATQRAVLSAEIAGVLTHLKFDVGNHVKKGRLVAKVSEGELGLRKKRSEYSLKHLSVKLKNLEKLIQRGLATEEEVAQAQMEKDVAYTDIQIFKRQISKSRILAPFSCVVVRRHVQRYEWVTGGQPVVEVVNPGKLRAVANIPSHLAVKLKKDQTHTLDVHDLNISVKGTVEAVVPEVDELSNTAQVIWKVDKGEHPMLAGMKGEVRIVEQREEAEVPESE